MCNLHRGILSKLFRDAVGEVDGAGLFVVVRRRFDLHLCYCSGHVEPANAFGVDAERLGIEVHFQGSDTSNRCYCGILGDPRGTDICTWHWFRYRLFARVLGAEGFRYHQDGV